MQIERAGPVVPDASRNRLEIKKHSPFCIGRGASLAASPASADVDVQVKYKTYDVKGLTAQEIHRDIDVKTASGQDAFIVGSAHSVWDWVAELESLGSSCKVKRSSVSLWAEITLPNWVDKERAPAEARVAWDRFFSWLKAHELRHKDISLEIARDMDRVLTTAQAPGTCDALQHELDRTAEQLHDREASIQEAFDSASPNALVELQ